MRSRDIANIIADNEQKFSPGKKISRKNNYLLGSRPGLKRLYSPETSWVRFQFASGGIEYHALKNLNAGGRKMQPGGSFGYVKICRDPLRYTAQGLFPTGKIYAEKIQQRESHHTSRAFEIQVMHEWECLCELYADLPLPTFVVDEQGEMTKAYLAMPFIVGISLGKYKDTYADTVSCQNLLLIILNMFYQVKMLHDKGMTHRDIRLDNFIVDPQTLTVTIIDFGLSSMTPEKEWNFCDRFALRRHIDASYESRARWWDLYHCREAAFELISGINLGSDHELLCRIKDVLFSLNECDENDEMDVKHFVCQLEQLFAVRPEQLGAGVMHDLLTYFLRE